MPALENAAHERFALAYVDNGRNGAAAYRLIYPTASPATSTTNGARLLRDARVRNRVDELTGEQISAAEHVFRQAQEYAVECLEHLMSIARDPEARHADRIRAAEIITDRGLGKPVQQVDVRQQVRYVIEAPNVMATFEEWARLAELSASAHAADVKFIEALAREAPDSTSDTPEA